MTAIAGFNALITCSTGASVTYSTIQGIKSFDLSDSRDSLDVTDFADGSVRARIMGLQDVSLDISGDYEPTDTGYLKLRAAYAAGDDLVTQIWHNTGTSSAGFFVTMKVESIAVNAAVDGKAEVSISLMTNGSSLTAIP